MRRHLQIMSLKKSDRQGDIATPPIRGVAMSPQSFVALGFANVAASSSIILALKRSIRAV